MMSVQREIFDGSAPDDLVVLKTAYKNAKTKNLKKQILSLYDQDEENLQTLRKSLYMGNKARTFSC